MPGDAQRRQGIRPARRLRSVRAPVRSTASRHAPGSRPARWDQFGRACVRDDDLLAPATGEPTFRSQMYPPTQRHEHGEPTRHQRRRRMSAIEMRLAGCDLAETKCALTRPVRHCAIPRARRQRRRARARNAAQDAQAARRTPTSSVNVRLTRVWSKELTQGGRLKSAAAPEDKSIAWVRGGFVMRVL